MWWDLIRDNFPTFLLFILAALFVGAEIIKALRVWREEKENRINEGVSKRQKELNLNDEFNKLHERFDQLDKQLTALEERIERAEQKLEDLTESDMHDIKAWIVEQYHKFYITQGWIDAFSADTIEKRYGDYLKEGGNSYIESLVTQLLSLSMDPSARR